MLKAKELTEKTNEELEELLLTSRKELYALKGEGMEQKKPLPHLKKQKKKEIARILTIQRKRYLEGDL